MVKALPKLLIIHPDGIVIEGNEVQPLNVPDKPIDAPTVAGNITEVSNIQLLNVFTISDKLGDADWNTTLVRLEQALKAEVSIDALKFVGNIIFFKLVQILKVLVIEYVALLEQVEGKYTFWRDVQLVNIVAKLTAVPAEAGVGKDVNLTHCNDIQVLNMLVKSVHILILGKVTFFKEIQLLNALLNEVQLFNVVGKDTVLKDLQVLNAWIRFVIDVAFDGSVISNKFTHPLNVVNILLKELAEVGITTTYKFIQFWNIYCILSTQVTVAGSFTYSKSANVTTELVPPLDENKDTAIPFIVPSPK